MRFLHTEFAALLVLTRANLSQAAFARIAGYTPRQVNNWARGRTAAPFWAIALAAVLQETSLKPSRSGSRTSRSPGTKPSACRQTQTRRRSDGQWLGWH